METVRFREVQEEAEIGRPHLAILIVPAVLSVVLWTQFSLSVSLVAIAVVWFGAVYFGLRVVGFMPGRTNEMRLDAHGIELEMEQRQTRIRWQDISRLSVMRLPSKKTPKWYLVAWLRDGVSIPDDPKGILPSFDSAIGGVRLCDIRTWDYTEAEITSVIQQYAGDTWKAADKS